MNWYENNKKEWKNIIEAVSIENNRSVSIIEKDTIQSLFLYKLHKLESDIVFKGGTSLSKAFRLINRFSEDIDLSLMHKPADSDKRRINKSILSVSNELGLNLLNQEKIKSRYNYNKYVFSYNSILDDSISEIIIETSFYQNAYPITNSLVYSYVNEYCTKNRFILPITFIDDFKMNIQSLDRTFIDKVFAVCDYKIQNMQERDSRHLYDIAKIIPFINFDDKLLKLIIQVRKERAKLKNNPSANFKYNINSLLYEIINSHFYEKDYNFITNKLLYENYPYNEAINNGILKVIESKKFNKSN